MALEQKLGLGLKQTQRLVMTPSLQQAIKLLQMTRMELEGTLTQELVENPVLEENSEVREEASDEPAEEAEAEAEDPMDEIDLEAYFSDTYDNSSGHASTREHREAVPMENILTREPDLYDHLLEQLHLADLPPLIRTLGELIIGNLDPDGFLVASDEELAALARQENGAVQLSDEQLACAVDQALAVVRGLEPPGIAWRDLRESLLAQLAAQGEEPDSLAWRMVDEAWPQVLKRQFQAVAKQLEVELAQLEPAVERIKTLDTRPGRKYDTERTVYIEPDVVVQKVSGEYVVQVNDDGLPRLRVSRAYRTMLKKMRAKGSEEEARQFIKEKMRSAMWLIKSLDQRQRTIYKVATSIVKQQRDFLERGIEHLRPMVLRDVADDIEMHESTVSRVVSNKYIHTPRGLLPMKFFFHSGIDREYGENISSLTVKRKLGQIIEAEDPKKPLSDSELMRILNREGIQIARRTVAKYRDELGIPSSTDRKQVF